MVPSDYGVSTHTAVIPPQEEEKEEKVQAELAQSREGISEAKVAVSFGATVLSKGWAAPASTRRKEAAFHPLGVPNIGDGGGEKSVDVVTKRRKRSNLHAKSK